MKTNIKPSRVRSIGPREAAFMLGEPIGDFTPEPMYHHGFGCECDACVFRCANNFEAVPDFDFPQTMRYEANDCESPENERRRRTNLLLKWAVLLTWAAAYVVIAVIVGVR